MLGKRVFKKKKPLKWLLPSSGNPSCTVGCEKIGREKSDKVNVTEGRSMLKHFLFTWARRSRITLPENYYFLFPSCTGFPGLPKQRSTNWVTKNNRNLVFHSSGGWKSKNKASRHQQGHVPSETCRGIFFLLFLAADSCSSSLTYLFIALYLLWSSQDILLCVPVFTWLSFYKGNSTVGVGSIPLQHDSILTNHTCNDPHSKQGCIPGSRGYSFHIFPGGRVTIHPTPSL